MQHQIYLLKRTLKYGMFVMKKLHGMLLALSILLLVQTICADDLSTTSHKVVGVGASFKSNEGFIYIPVHLTKNFMLEPFLRYEDAQRDFDGSKSSRESYSIGAGFFGVFTLTEKAQVYIGVRVAYVNESSRQPIATLVLSDGPFPVPPVVETSTSKTDQDGYSIAPTLGFEYSLFDRLSIGGEVAWEITKLEGSTGSQETRLNYDSKFNKTTTNIILRFYF